MAVLSSAGVDFPAGVPVLVIGAGACGLVAALAAREGGAEALVLERDAVPTGSTSLSSGFVPAAGTRFQAARGVADTPALLAADVQRKAGGEVDPAVLDAVCRESGPAIEWLADRHGLPIVLVEGFLYPGHSVLRMHAHAERTGAALLGALLAAAGRAGVDVVTSAAVADLYADADGRVRGVRLVRPDGSDERIGCEALVLACNGYGGNKAMVRRHIPEMADALYFGHAGNQGDAVAWGTALGGEARHMTAYQGHGSVATPHGILVTWAIMMAGGIQVNADGRRFSNEHHGYSEQAVAVLAQPGGVAFDVYDARLHRLGHDFEDYRTAVAAGAVREGADLPALAAALGLPADALAATLAEVERLRLGEGTDAFGRDFTADAALAPPFYGVKVTGALFHTQGGLAIDGRARVLGPAGRALPNLFAGGGAACGVSGARVEGYLSGNGLLAAVALGRIAGREAAALARAVTPPRA